jgi:hypothetical protein
MLLDLLNNISYTPEQVHLIALAANAAGETAEAHYYMAELHVMNGDLPLAIRQLELALATPGIEPCSAPASRRVSRRSGSTCRTSRSTAGRATTSRRRRLVVRSALRARAHFTARGRLRWHRPR